MVPFVVMLTSLLLFRLAGACGISGLASWRAATRGALAVLFLFTSTAHFTPTKEDLIQMVPPQIPYARQIVLFTGLCEVCGAIGVLTPRLQRAAGIALMVFLVAVFPANIYAAQAEIALRGKPATPLRLRSSMQLVYIGLTWWSTQTGPSSV
jgi:uncharacterized membrane protein